MTAKHRTLPPRRDKRHTVIFEIELPVLSDEAAAAVADILVQLYHRFEAAYYGQILNHHADQAVARVLRSSPRHQSATGDEPF
jgi:hypothetical protein